MPDITPGQTVTFTVSSAPRRVAERKTIERLMRMQPKIRKGLRTLQAKRRDENVTYTRAGRPWTNRKRATRLIRAEVGAQFTLHVTPQIVNDLQSVQKYLSR